VRPRLGVPRVGGHQAGLDGEDQVVCCSDGARTVGGDASQLQQERADGLAQQGRARSLVGQPQLLDALEEAVGLDHHAAAVGFGGVGGVGDDGECAHGRQRRGTDIQG
jgi:hypothetical protein